MLNAMKDYAGSDSIIGSSYIYGTGNLIVGSNPFSDPSFIITNQVWR